MQLFFNRERGHPPDDLIFHLVIRVRSTLITAVPELDVMKEKFAKLLLGEDMSGTGKGVSSALALSNAVTNLAASVFGEHRKLEPMAPDTKERWKREVGWLLSVTDHIVEFVPTRQTAENGTTMEVIALHISQLRACPIVTLTTYVHLLLIGRSCRRRSGAT